MTLQRLVFCLIALVAGLSRPAAAAEPAPADEAGKLAFFESKVRPVLVKHCYDCHSAQSGKSESGLLLDSREGIRRGGDRGPAVTPGEPENSLLLTVVSHTDPDLTMPPRKERLPDTVIADLREWIRQGAADPREATGSTLVRSTVDIAAGRMFWSFQKPVVPALPEVEEATWPKRDLDRFLLAALEQNDLAPSPDADPATLLRRLHFDLVGLPPSPADLQAFVARMDQHGFDAALAAEVDRLLATPQFGERWGRHWLDVARFAESSGKEANISFPDAWRYRDYVIDAVNADVPYDRFLTEQIAGDLLPWQTNVERARLLIATGFLAVGSKNLDEMNAFQFLADVADEQIDAVTRAVMGSSVACARCHDHKFDPFTMQDYYALAGIFVSTKTCFGTAVSPANRMAGDPLTLPPVEGQKIYHPSIPAEKVKQLKEQLAALKAEGEAGQAALMKAVLAGEDPDTVKYTLRDALRIFWTSGGIEGQLEKVDENGQALPLAIGTVDRETIFDAPLLERGEIGRPGEPVPRGFPQVIELEGCVALPADQSGRLELARWLTHPDHPLTARVMANRVWKHLFGAGLVRTVDNFGTSGERPSHPELLDYLATRFVAEGWSVKRLVREIVLSRAYRQDSTYRSDAFQTDPDNRLVWRMSKRRLDAEAIRDAMLAAAGDLDLARPEGSLVARVIGDRPISLIGLDKRIPADLDGSVHRSVYLPVLRDRLPDALDLFDFAEPSLVTGDRETTNVPLQALYLMNSPFVQDRSKALAGRLEREASSPEGQVKLAFAVCFGREAEPDETAMGVAFLQGGPESSHGEASPSPDVLQSFCQALLCTAEFRNVD